MPQKPRRLSNKEIAYLGEVYKRFRLWYKGRSAVKYENGEYHVTIDDVLDERCGTLDDLKGIMGMTMSCDWGSQWE